MSSSGGSSSGGALADSPSGDVATGVADGPAEGASDGAVVCNAIVNGATAVTSEQIAQNPPTLVGGTIANGTYFLTGLAIYTEPEGPTGAGGTTQTTIQITGTTIQIASSGTPATRTATLAISGIDFTSTDTCPDTMVIQGTYTATTTSLVVQYPGGTDDAGARTVQETFAKQ